MNTTIQKLFLIIATTATIICPSVSFAANTVIDVMMVYTKGTTDLYGSDPTTRFNQIIQVTNQIYKDSDVNVELRLVKSQLVDYTDTNSAEIALNDITYAKIPAFKDIATLRDQAKADMIIFYRPYGTSMGSCGIAWINGIGTNGDFSNLDLKKFMYAHVAINSCGDYVTAHELGHNMGLRHSRLQDGSGGTFPYALGYGVVNQFTTIMAYQTSFNVDYWAGKLYKFSNPGLTCKGVPCGVDRNDAQNGSDAHYVLNITAPQIAKFNTATDSGVSLSSSSVTSSSAKSETAKSSSVSSKSSVASTASSKPNSSSVKSESAKSSIASSKSSMASVTSSKPSSSSAKSEPAKSSIASSKSSVTSIASSKPNASSVKSESAKSSIASSKSSAASIASSKPNASSAAATASLKSSSSARSEPAKSSVASSKSSAATIPPSSKSNSSVKSEMARSSIATNNSSVTKR